MREKDSIFSGHGDKSSISTPYINNKSSTFTSQFELEKSGFNVSNDGTPSGNKKKV